MKPVIVVHGGAGAIMPGKDEKYMLGVKRAVVSGFKKLQQGGSVVDAVEEAVVVMENDPIFNAASALMEVPVMLGTSEKVLFADILRERKLKLSSRDPWLMTSEDGLTEKFNRLEHLMLKEVTVFYDIKLLEKYVSLNIIPRGLHIDRLPAGEFNEEEKLMDVRENDGGDVQALDFNNEQHKTFLQAMVICVPTLSFKKKKYNLTKDEWTDLQEVRSQLNEYTFTEADKGGNWVIMNRKQYDEMTDHVLLTERGASQFAKAMNIPEVSEESLITEKSLLLWKKPIDYQQSLGTVGAVAVDSEGNVACATSTGGMTNKMLGRVGDTPCIGSGGYADNFSGAVSTTGMGEAIMKVTLARLVLFHIEQGKSPTEAAETALKYMLDRIQSRAGLIVVNNSGDYAAVFTTNQMSWAVVKDDQLHYGLSQGELHTCSISDVPL
ncbi:isoaspartyl peptidase/L-asparaginase-like [Protopterus annectens]|uniref:isoaspartyl peptidase/L-asparaginase-like n=1 Tax=Protopterus annectens TaxID=7888 RepID=UPI001CFAC861|nr:isoaspartyl peptidase/L-asparaginase-like [Protopterus annectens]